MKSVRVKLVNDSSGLILVDDQPIPPGGTSEWMINKHSDGQVCRISTPEESHSYRKCIIIAGSHGDARTYHAALFSDRAGAHCKWYFKFPGDSHSHGPFDSEGAAMHAAADAVK